MDGIVDHRSFQEIIFRERNGNTEAGVAMREVGGAVEGGALPEISRAGTGLVAGAFCGGDGVSGEAGGVGGAGGEPQVKSATARPAGRGWGPGGWPSTKAHYSVGPDPLTWSWVPA